MSAILSLKQIAMPNTQGCQGGGDASSQIPIPSKNVKGDDKKSRLLHILPKLPSSDSLSNSPGPSSPGLYIIITNQYTNGGN